MATVTDWGLCSCESFEAHDVALLIAEADGAGGCGEIHAEYDLQAIADEIAAMSFGSEERLWAAVERHALEVAS